MPTKNPLDAPFLSTDIYLVAALTAVGFPHDYTETTLGRVTFYWNNPEARTQAKNYYAHRLALEDAMNLTTAIKTLKTILHNPIE